MRTVFIDESARDHDFYFFGALIVDDQALLHIEKELNAVGQLVARNSRDFRATTDFHAVNMFHGNEAWKGVSVPLRVRACKLAAKAIAQSGAEFVFRGVDLNRLRERYPNPYPAHLLTFAHLLGGIDKLMKQRGEVGIVLADDHHSADASRRNLHDFKIRAVPGYTERRLTQLADTVFFGPSHASRLLQAADIATYFLNRSRTIVETDARSRRAIEQIAEDIRQVTSSEYVWEP